MATLSPSLGRLFREIDARWPNRDRRTDGWYASPSVRRSVGHNPGARGLVHAIDVDDDGIDGYWIVNNIVRNTGLWYIIYNRTYWSNTYGWRARAYTGRNPHTDHLHIEIYQTIAAENYGGGWGIHSGGIGGAIGGGLAQLLPTAYFWSTGWDYRGAVDGSAENIEGSAGLTQGLTRWIEGI